MSRPQFQPELEIAVNKIFFLAYFPKMKVGLSNHHSFCLSVSLCVTH
jgi:hypothetical protein